MGENPAVNRNFLWLVLLLVGAAAKLSAQGTAFYFQGRLNDGGTSANGVYDLRFALYDASTNGNLISGPLTNYAATVSGGLFETTVNFGSVFTGTNYWLALGVRTNLTIPSTNTFTLIWPRQPLLPTPYAIFANSASNVLGTLSATQLVGTLPSAQISGNYFGAVNFTNGNNAFLGSFAGNGLNVSNLNGSLIATGTVADARLSTNVALLNTNQTFSGVNVFNNATNSFTGSFFGNGLVGWIPIPSNSVQAVRDTGYLLLSSNLTTVTLPPTASLLTGDIVRISGAGSGGWAAALNNNQSMQGIFLSASNSTWVAADNVNFGWQAIAASADGLKMVASAGSSGGIYTSTDAGKTWANASATTFSPFSVASSADGVKLVGAINGGNIVVSTNSGNTWQITSAPSANWTCVASSADGSKLAATINTGNIYVSMNSGSTWTARASSSAWDSVALSADGSRMAAVVFGGKISTSTNFGTNWTAQAGSATANWISIASSADGSKLAAAVNGARIHTSSDYGVTWTAQSGAPTNFWYNLTSSSDGGRLAAVVNPGGIYYSANSGITWVKQPVADQNWKCITCSDDGTRVAADYSILINTGGIYYWQATAQFTSTSITNGSLTGGQGSAVEIQYLGNGTFMPIGGTGTFWAN
jgi:hypothetical protein